MEEGSLEEELRLFYVAITRAREKLFLIRAATRMQRGLSRVQLPSPFLTLLPENETKTARPEDLVQPMSADEMRRAFAEIFKILER